MKWISVNDKLPEVNKQVLCWDGEEMSVNRWTGEFKHPRKKTDPIWGDPTGHYDPLGITNYCSHWAELPKPPK